MSEQSTQWATSETLPGPTLGPIAGYNKGVLLLLIWCLPMGVAAQSLAVAIAASLCIGSITKLTTRQKSQLWRYHKHATLCGIGFIFTAVLATVWQTNGAIAKIPHFIVGYLGWLTLPILVATILKDQEFERFTAKHLGWMTLGWAAIALSQYLIGWRIAGINVVADAFRPRGLYSHPLTLAYCSFLLWPMAVNTFFRYPSNWRAITFFCSVAIIVFTTQSRTIQAVAFGIFLLNAIHWTKGKQRMAILAITTIMTAGLLFTENPISFRFHQALQPTADVQSHFHLDRIAFWKAHGLMFQEAPIIGHGIGLDETFRIPYYEKLGLTASEQFTKFYAAHNAYLQIAVNTGIIGLCFFMGWYICQYQACNRIANTLLRRSFRQTLTSFGLVMLTQNAFQDSEVRLGLTLVSAAIFTLAYRNNTDTIVDTSPSRL